jgi:hypothetical protein
MFGKKSILRFLLWMSLSATCFSACGGVDKPFILNDPGPPSNNNSKLNLPQTPTNDPSGSQGCRVLFTPKLSLTAQLAPGTSSSANAQGVIQSLEKDIPAIPFNFNGNQVVMNGDEFQEASLTLGTQQIKVRQKPGTRASGDYNADTGSITLNGVEFEITSPLNIPFPTFSLTTESISIDGDFGSLSGQGSKLDKNSKELKLVGAFKIDSFPLPEFVGAAVVVTFNGTVDQIPDPANCVGSGGGGGGVVLKEVVSDPNGNPNEIDLSQNNTLEFGRVFIPEQGVDHPTPTDTKFSITKTLRIENLSSSELSGTFSNANGFSITPNNVTVAAGAKQDVKIVFGFSPMVYSASDPAPSKDITASLSLGSTTVTLAGEAKRAAPELGLGGTDSNALSTIDLGSAPAPILGRGSSAKLDCRPGSGQHIPTLAQKVSLQNTGIRPLQILRINPPVDNTHQTSDPYCVNYGSEFLRMALNVEGHATCNSVTSGGRSYLTDQCQIPVGDGKVNFKVVYLPMNASPVREATGNTLAKDTGKIMIESNDPRYDGSPGNDLFALNLVGGVSPDRSNVLKIRKDDSNTEIPLGGNLRINIPNNTETTVTQKLVLLNRLDEPLNNVQISVEDTAHFQILSTPTPPPTTIPAVASGASAEPGKAEFYVRFTKPAGATSGSFSTPLKVSFVPDDSGVANTFEVTLIGSINYQILVGDVDMNVELIASYIDTTLLRSAPLDSLDFRQAKFAAFKPGPLKMHFEPVAGSDVLRNVTIVNKPGLEPTNQNLLNNVRALSHADRAELFRAYSTRLTGYPGNVEDANHDGVPDCTEPEGALGDYEEGQCSFFYYIFATKPGKPGTYNDETGELIFTDIDLRLLNPYHETRFDYLSSQRTNTDLQGSISTLTTDSLYAGSLPLVVDPRIGSADIAVPDSAAESILSNPQFECPGGDSWKPTDAPKPAFGCYITSSSPHYLKGFRVTPLPDGDYSVVISMLTEIKPSGPPGYVPSFMANGRLWVAVQGRLHPCSAGGCHR